MKQIVAIVCLVLSLSMSSACSRNPKVSSPVSPGNVANTDQAVAPASKSPSDTTSQDLEVKTGKIPVNLYAVPGWQENVNQGHGRWMLEPLIVAHMSACGLGICRVPEDAYKLISQVDVGANGTGEAIVEVPYGTKIYTIHLVQPFGPGKGSIWLVDRLEEKHQR